MKIKEHFITTRDGIKIKTRKTTIKGSSRTLLLIHDLGAESDDLLEIEQNFDVKEVVSFDLRGHGHSDLEKGDFGHFLDTIEDLKEVIDFYQLKNIDLVSFGRSYLFILFLFLEHEEYFSKYIKNVFFIDPKILENKKFTKQVTKYESGEKLLDDLYVFHKEFPIKVSSYLSYVEYFSRVTEPLYFFSSNINLLIPVRARPEVLEVFSLFEESIINAKVNKHKYNGERELAQFISRGQNV